MLARMRRKEERSKDEEPKPSQGYEGSLMICFLGFSFGGGLEGAWNFTCWLIQVPASEGLLHLPLPVAYDQDVTEADKHRVGMVMVHIEHANPCIEPWNAEVS